jgi:pyruvate dehydrogenase (quinone)
MAQMVSDYILARLREWGIHRIYGYPGDGINGFLGALDRASGDPEFIQARHEEMAAFMACGHAKFSGDVGVCMATSGPGAIHLLNGLYDARLDHQPVVAIVGQQKRVSIGAHYQQEVDLNTLFKDVSEYVQTCMEPAQARHIVDRAVRIALSEKAVSTIIVPEDVQETEAVTSPPRMHGSVYSTVGYSRPHVVPYEADLKRAAEVLNGCSKVAMLVGQGALAAADEVVEAAELLGAGVAKALLGRAALPDDLPFVTGPIGLLGSRPTYEMMNSCDCLFVIGSSMPYAEWLPEEGKARGVQIDLEGRMIGSRYPMDVLLVGDAKDTLKALIPHLRRKEDRSWRGKIEKDVAEWWRLMEDWAMHWEGQPMNPQRVAWELSKRLPDKAILTADSGSSTTWWARQIRIRKGMMASLSGTLATMGPGVPYAIGAKFAHPTRPVIAFAGDGAMQMNGINELLTVAKYWRTWADPTWVVCVFKNKDLNQVTWEQRVLAGDPKYRGSQDVPDFLYARYAEMLGLAAVTVEDPERVGEAWDQLLHAGRPALLEAVVDPEIPPLPPHVKFEQGKKMAEALLHGDPELIGVATKTMAGKVREFIPGR